MSIIQEALKKIGSPDSKQEEKTQVVRPPEPKPVSVPVINKSSGVKNEPGPKFIYYAIIVLLVLLLAGIVVRVSYSPASSSSASNIPTPHKKIEPILPSIERREEPVTPRHRKENIGGFVLNGIMLLVDGPRAIINGIIVGEGETIDGAKVEKIKKDKVLLNYKDSEVSLDINK